MNKKTEKTNEIKVVDEHSKPMIIVEFTSFTLHKPLTGAEEWIPGLPAYELDGERCNQIDADTWKTLHSGRIMHRA